MKVRCKIICIIVILINFIYIETVVSAVSKAITVTNCMTRATIIFNCNVIPVYMIFSLHDPERIVIDFFKNYSIQKKMLPMTFNGKNLIKCVRLSTPVKPNSMRIVLDLVYASTIEVVTQKKIDENYCLILTIFKKRIPFISSSVHAHKTFPTICSKTHFINVNRKINNKIHHAITNIRFNNSNNHNDNKKKSSVIVVAIDAGHGGQDPGATGYNGIYEKNITINIAKKLKQLLDSDSMFSAIMIRDGDYFLPVTERSDIARKKNANVLISIHTDSTLNPNVRGASVWVLSNRRAKSEMMYLLNRSEKHSELLGGLGDILTSYCKNDPYFNHFILDLQFGYSQRVGYDIAMHVLRQLKHIGMLHKDSPEYSSFGILRSPDIPSLLVETGFISNKNEVYLLSSDRYQKKIASALYRGLREYFISTQLKKPLCNYSKNKSTYVVAAS